MNWVTMAAETDSLRELYLDVAGDETLTDSQEESPSHAPIEETETELERMVSDVLRDDGLADAVDGSEGADQPM